MENIDDTENRTVAPSDPIIVYCPSFDENSGGSIVLHALVDRMRSIGVDAYAAPLVRQYSPSVSPWIRARRIFKKIRKKVRKKERFRKFPAMDVPLAPAGLAKHAIAVYPEKINGNPLGAKFVVRWLLHKPGRNGTPLDINDTDAVFFYQNAFRSGIKGVPDDNLLRVRWLRSDVYINNNLATRKGSCRMLRKGSLKGSNAVPDDDTAIALDGKDHEEIAEVFNSTEVFYTHDPYTLYCYYAALCGCVPVIVPEDGLSSQAWRQSYAMKHGIAYGESELEWARETRGQLLAVIDGTVAAEIEGVRSFLVKLKAQFG